jgi:hypothetical protein
MDVLMNERRCDGFVEVCVMSVDVSDTDGRYEGMEDGTTSVLLSTVVRGKKYQTNVRGNVELLVSYIYDSGSGTFKIQCLVVADCRSVALERRRLLCLLFQMSVRV